MVFHKDISCKCKNVVVIAVSAKMKMKKYLKKKNQLKY